MCLLKGECGSEGKGCVFVSLIIASFFTAIPNTPSSSSHSAPLPLASLPLASLPLAPLPLAPLQVGPDAPTAVRGQAALYDFGDEDNGVMDATAVRLEETAFATGDRSSSDKEEKEGRGQGRTSNKGAAAAMYDLGSDAGTNSTAAMKGEGEDSSDYQQQQQQRGSRARGNAALYDLGSDTSAGESRVEGRGMERSGSEADDGGARVQQSPRDDAKVWWTSLACFTRPRSHVHCMVCVGVSLGLDEHGMS